MLADLHVHTTASDGTETPEEVVARAAALGIRILAISDHDTVDGIPPAMEEGSRRGVEILPAIEMGAEYKGLEIHVLGYMIDINSRELLGELEFFRSTRLERVGRMVRRLNGMGFAITLQRVLEIAGHGSVGRPHIARALVEKGVVESVGDAFDRYIGEGRPGFEPRFKYTPDRAVRILRAAGGVAVLAHPGLAQADELITDLIPDGLQGVEAYHPGHAPWVASHYLDLCRRYGLVATGGSDYHGVGGKGENRLGTVTVSGQVVERIKQLARKNRKPRD